MQQISRPENRANVASVRVGKILMDEFTAIPEERLSTGVLWSRLHKPAVSFFFMFWHVSIGFEIPNGLSSGDSFRDEWIASCCVRDDLQQVEGAFCPRNQVAGHCRIQGLVVPAPWYERHEYKGSDDVLEGK
jgi:hypothetical protein